MFYKYCPICGRKLQLRDSWDEGKIPYCENDDIMYFDNPKPCVVVAVIKDDEILLLKQSYIYKNSKVLVSGYISVDEKAEETAYREVKEETGIEIGDIEYLGSDIVPGKELLMLTYMAKYKSGVITKSAEVEGLSWVKLENALDEMKEDTVGRCVVKKVLALLKNR